MSGVASRPVSDLLITDQLYARPRRLRDPAVEVQSLQALSLQMVDDPPAALQNLLDLALELCGAGSAGISVIETGDHGETILRWKAMAGQLGGHVGETTPR